MSKNEERESVRERGSRFSFQNGHKFSEGVVPDGKDFRQNLVLVFVNNINPIVDYVRLWGIFKPFGRVRDVFLSPKNNTM